MDYIYRIYFFQIDANVCIQKCLKCTLPGFDLVTPLDLHSLKDEKILILGGFNIKLEEADMKSFYENYYLKSWIKQPTCYKNPNKPTCSDLVLTNVPCMFQSTCVIGT